MYEHERVSFEAVGICLCPVLIYVRMSVCVCVCMHVALCDCVNACVFVHVSFKSIGVRVSCMCLHELNLAGPRSQAAGGRFFIFI